MIGNVTLVFIMVLATMFEGLSQQTDCDALYKKATEKSLAPYSGMRIMDYGVKLIGKKRNNSDKEDRVKIYCDSSHRYIITDIVQVYVDKEHSIMLAPRSKTIMINYTDAKSKKSLNEVQADVADSLFRAASTIVSCKEITNNVLYDREMTVVPKSGKAGFSQSVYWIKSGESTIYKMSLTYKSGDYDRVEYTFYQDSKGLSNEKINRPVIDLFFKKDGSLLPVYKGYHVTDNRNISSKN